MKGKRLTRRKLDPLIGGYLFGWTSSYCDSLLSLSTAAPQYQPQCLGYARVAADTVSIHRPWYNCMMKEFFYCALEDKSLPERG